MSKTTSTSIKVLTEGSLERKFSVDIGTCQQMMLKIHC